MTNQQTMLFGGFLGVALSGALVLAAGSLGWIGPSWNGLAQGPEEQPYQARSVTEDLVDQVDLTKAQRANFTTSFDVGAPAPSATEAVTRFVEAEIARDYEASFSLLSSDDRQRWSTPDDWQFAHNRLPILTSSNEPGDISELAQYATSVALEPELNLSVGAIPAHASVIWAPVTEDGGWRIAYLQSEFHFEYPNAQDARAAVTTWIQARQDCDDTASLEFSSGLLGTTVLADEICGWRGAIEVSGPGSISDLTSPAVILNAFGSEAEEFSYVFSVNTPAPADVVVAPLGDQWVIVAIL